MVTTVIFRDFSDSIVVGIHANPKGFGANEQEYDDEDEENSGPDVQGSVAAILLTVGATLLMSTFIFHLITEKKTRFKHQVNLNYFRKFFSYY